MKKIILGTLIASALSFSAVASTSTPTEIDFSKLSPAQQDQIGKIASDYIIKNPEVLIQASQSLQQKQEIQRRQDLQMAATTAVSEKEALLHDPASPVIGPKDAKVAMVIFTDYNCIYCSKSSPDVSAIIKEHPDVKFVFKDLPVLSVRFPSSLYAAQVGLQVFKEKGNDTFLKYHENIYKTGLNEGNLTEAVIDKTAKDLGVTPKVSRDDFAEQIKNNEDLAAKLKINGTPGFVLMSNTNPTPETTAIIPGYVEKAQIEGIISEIGKK